MTIRNLTDKPTITMIRKKNGTIECPSCRVSFSSNDKETAEEKAIEWFGKHMGHHAVLDFEDEK